MRPTLAQLREAFAEYVSTEGCSCCQDREGHEAAANTLGKLLRVRKYEDGSGYDFRAYRRPTTPEAK